MSASQVQVLESGILSTVQDLGRFGGRGLGFSVCGALEGDHLRLANAAVGNPRLGNTAEAAALELSGGPVRLELTQSTWACWFGVGACSLESGKPERITRFETRGRGLLALAGGIAVKLVQGSRSTDVRAGFGGFVGRALRRGDLLPLGDSQSALEPRLPRWRVPPFLLEGPVRVVRGPEWPHLNVASQRALEGGRFRVSVQSNRMGLRLEGRVLELKVPLELRSGPVLPGTVQLPPSGQLTVLLQDAGTVGGYPRVLTIAAVDLPRLAVLAPGTPLWFRVISSDEARRLFLERERQIQTLIHSIAQRRIG